MRIYLKIIGYSFIYACINLSYLIPQTYFLKTISAVFLDVSLISIFPDFLSSVLLIFFASKLPRRFSMILICLSLSILSTVICLVQTFTSGSTQQLVIIIFCIITKVIGLFALGLLILYMNELFATKYRAISIGTIFFVGEFISFLF